MAASRMTPLARHLQLRLPASWLPARSISTSHPLVPPQASTSQVEGDLAAVPGLQDTAAAASSSASTSQHKLPYYITRTEMNQALPVYSNIRSGGTRQEILIRHISGNLEALKHDFQARFPKVKQVTINGRTRTLVIKGMDPSVGTIKEWLQSKGL